MRRPQRPLIPELYNLNFVLDCRCFLSPDILEFVSVKTDILLDIPHRLICLTTFLSGSLRLFLGGWTH
jgi:hypothetical protein